MKKLNKWSYLTLSIIISLFVVTFAPVKSFAVVEDLSLYFSYEGPIPSEYQLFCEGQRVHTFQVSETGDNIEQSFLIDIPTYSVLKFVLVAIVNSVPLASNPYYWNRDATERPSEVRSFIHSAKCLLKMNVNYT